MSRHLLWLALGVAWMCSASDGYVRDDSVDSSGTYLVEELEIAPLFLVERFGTPNAGDGIRVSGHYTFRSPRGVVFTVYDYKSTTLWADDEGLPTPEEFWNLSEPVDLSVGARGSDVTEFKAWLLEQYRAWRKK